MWGNWKYYANLWSFKDYKIERFVFKVFSDFLIFVYQITCLWDKSNSMYHMNFPIENKTAIKISPFMIKSNKRKTVNNLVLCPLSVNYVIYDWVTCFNWHVTRKIIIDSNCIVFLLLIIVIIYILSCIWHISCNILCIIKFCIHFVI